MRHSICHLVGLCWLLATTFLAIPTSVSSQTVTREDIVASRDKRRRQLENILVGIEKKMADHLSGKKVLGDHQVEHFEHKMRVYQHQIEELDRELDDEEMEHKMRRAEEMRLAKEHDEL